MSYFAKVSTDAKTTQRICEGSHRNVLRVPQNRVVEMGYVSVVQLLKMPPYDVVVANGGNLHAGSAWKDGIMAGMLAMDPVRCHILS